MRLAVAVRYIGSVVVMIGLFMIVSAGVGALYGDDSALLLLVSGILGPSLCLCM